MALIDDVFKLCKTLTETGWGKLFAKHGLRIKQRNAAGLAKELKRPLVDRGGKTTIQRYLVGFEDFSLDGTRGIEPRSPARSLFFHALASPNVLNQPDGSSLKYFPTLKELETVENYVFGVEPPSIKELTDDLGRLTVVVLAYEYRPASQTCPGVQADMVFARTGIARVGTAGANYRADLRGFTPRPTNESSDICVSPARFAAFLAVPMKGDKSQSLPMRYRDEADAHGVADDRRDFWVPVHKLFSGSECLRDINVKSVTFDATIINEKIFRTRKIGLGLRAVPTTPPFRITAGLAELSSKAEHGSGLLVPLAQPLVEKARDEKGKLVTFKVPRGKSKKQFDAFSPEPFAVFRSSPEYVHIRTRVDENGVEDDLNALTTKQLTQTINGGNYQALHYVDHTGDGWMDAVINCTGLSRNRNVDPVAISGN
jgi:hypothetical protein